MASQQTQRNKIEVQRVSALEVSDLPRAGDILQMEYPELVTFSENDFVRTISQHPHHDKSVVYREYLMVYNPAIDEQFLIFRDERVRNSKITLAMLREAGL